MPEMTPKQFERVGQTLFGERWQNPLARALDISPSTLKNYRAGKPRKDGKPQIPRTVWGCCQHFLANPELALELGLSPQAKHRRKL